MVIIGCRFHEVMYQQKSTWRELVIFTERELEVLKQFCSLSWAWVYCLEKQFRRESNKYGLSLSKCLHVHAVKREPLLCNQAFQEDINLLQSSLHNRRYFFSFFRRATASAKRARSSRHGPSHVARVWRSLLPSGLSSLAWKRREITPSMQVNYKEMIGPSLDYK